VRREWRGGADALLSAAGGAKKADDIFSVLLFTFYGDRALDGWFGRKMKSGGMTCQADVSSALLVIEWLPTYCLG